MATRFELLAAQKQSVEFVNGKPNLFAAYNRSITWSDSEQRFVFITEQTGGYAPRRWVEEDGEGGYILAHRIGFDTAGMMWGDSPHRIRRTPITPEEVENFFLAAALARTLRGW